MGWLKPRFIFYLVADLFLCLLLSFSGAAPGSCEDYEVVLNNLLRHADASADRPPRILSPQDAQLRHARHQGPRLPPYASGALPLLGLGSRPITRSS